MLGADMKKMRSTVKAEGENANAMLIDELIDSVLAILKPTPEPMSLAWNVIAWQFNSTSAGKNTICDINNWCKTTSPGIYISHTNAKISKALGAAKKSPDKDLLDDEDANLCGFASYFQYHWKKAIENKEPCYIAQFALSLAKKLSEIYAKKSIRLGEPGLLYSLQYAVGILQQCMTLLGMKVLPEV